MEIRGENNKQQWYYSDIIDKLLLPPAELRRNVWATYITCLKHWCLGWTDTAQSQGGSRGGSMTPFWTISGKLKSDVLIWKNVKIIILLEFSCHFSIKQHINYFRVYTHTPPTPYIRTLIWLENSLNIESCIMYDFGVLRIQTAITLGVVSQIPLFKYLTPQQILDPPNLQTYKLRLNLQSDWTY